MRLLAQVFGQATQRVQLAVHRTAGRFIESYIEAALKTGCALDDHRLNVVNLLLWGLTIRDSDLRDLVGLEVTRLQF